MICAPEQVTPDIPKCKKKAKENQKHLSKTKKTRMCLLHGAGRHGTSECHMIKIIENKGWANNKENYKSVQALRNSIRPFVVEGIVDGVRRNILIDPGQTCL